MRKILVIALILHLSVNAQEKLLTIQEAVLKGRTGSWRLNVFKTFNLYQASTPFFMLIMAK